jgi:Fe2+ or Zn2+ uptake regulation protein
MIIFLIMTDCVTAHEHRVDIEAFFRGRGMHCTVPRRRVWDFFAGQAQGYTIAEAVAALKRLHIGQATVYRAVELFVQCGLLTTTREESGKVRYLAVCPGHSHALICSRCHTVVEFDDCDLALLEKLLMARTGFAIQGHHLEVYGTCPACAAR